MFTIKNIAILIFSVIAPFFLIWVNLIDCYRVLARLPAIISSKRKRQKAGLTSLKGFTSFTYNALFPFATVFFFSFSIFSFVPLPVKTVGEAAVFKRLDLNQCEVVKAKQIWEKEGVLRMFDVVQAKKACKKD